jgi:hypothetical protein
MLESEIQFLEAPRTYRRKSPLGQWHFCPNCSRYPSARYEVRKTPPEDVHGVCRECRAKDANGQCADVA